MEVNMVYARSRMGASAMNGLFTEVNAEQDNIQLLQPRLHLLLLLIQINGIVAHYPLKEKLQAVLQLFC